jgi:hypothetical protein
MPTTSRPASAGGHAHAWIGVGAAKRLESCASTGCSAAGSCGATLAKESAGTSEGSASVIRFVDRKVATASAEGASVEDVSPVVLSFLPSLSFFFFFEGASTGVGAEDAAAASTAFAFLDFFGLTGASSAGAGTSSEGAGASRASALRFFFFFAGSSAAEVDAEREASVEACFFFFFLGLSSCVGAVGAFSWKWRKW